MAEEQALFNLKSIALHALQMIRPFLKMSGEQSSAWDVVVLLLGGGSPS
jgi:hypothetical protein